MEKGIQISERENEQICSCQPVFFLARKMPARARPRARAGARATFWKPAGAGTGKKKMAIILPVMIFQILVNFCTLNSKIASEKALFKHL